MLIYLTHEKMLDFRAFLMSIFVEGHVIYSVTEVPGFLETIYVSVTLTLFIYSPSMLIKLFCFAFYFFIQGVKISLKFF